MYSFGKLFFGVICEMAPYLLLGFLVAGILHTYVPRKFFAKYLAGNNMRSVLWAALMGIPLPLCSCGIIPTAIGLRREGASKGAVASFLIATPQTGIDSILATFSLMGVSFALVRPIAALVTGVAGGWFVNHLMKEEKDREIHLAVKDTGKHRLGDALHYAFVDMMGNIGGHLIIGLVMAAFIQIVVPDDFFLAFTDYPLLQMLLMIAVAIPMYVCSTGSIPIAVTLLLKGLSPGAAFILLMAGPAVNMASVFVVRKVMGWKFCTIYLMSIIVGAMFFGMLLNHFWAYMDIWEIQSRIAGNVGERFTIINVISGIILTLLIINIFVMKIFRRNQTEAVKEGETVFCVEGMHCIHCKEAAERAVMSLDGVISAKVNLEKKSINIEGLVKEADVKKAIEKAGFEFKGKI